MELLPISLHPYRGTCTQFLVLGLLLPVSWPSYSLLTFGLKFPFPLEHQ